MSPSRWPLDLRDRNATFRDLASRRFDVVVVGGGIVAAGIARDAAMRGLDVALIEARDLASGTSSASSIAGDVQILGETVRERTVLGRIAPHLARSVRFLAPRTSRASLLAARLALEAHEWLGDVRDGERHAILSPEEIAAREPLFRTEGIAGAVAYPELVTDDARLAVANARAAAANGAIVATWAPPVHLDGAGAVVRDAHDRARQARVEARIVVDANVQPSKGVHLVTTRARLPIRDAVVLRDPGGRIVLAVPRGRFVYLGTTEIDDVDYVLACARETFPGADLGPRDVVAAWAGGGSARRHRIQTSEDGVVSVAGGKPAAYRRIAAEVVDGCVARLRAKARPCRTGEEPLPGGDVDDLSRVEAALRREGLDDGEAERVARLYGSEAEDVARGRALLEGEVEQAVLREGALTLDDWWSRRSARARFDLTPEASLERGARAMARLLDWSNETRVAAVARCIAARAASLRACREEPKVRAAVAQTASAR